MRPLLAAVAGLLLVGAGVLGVLHRHESGDAGRLARACARVTPQGGEGEAAREREQAAAVREREGARVGAAGGGRAAVSGLFSGPAENPAAECAGRPGGHPESFADLAKANSADVARDVAPGTSIRPGAYSAAIAERNRLARAGAAPTGGAPWTPYGDTPLLANQTEYDQTNGSTREGFVGLSGRTTSFARDAAGHLFAATSNGGVWRSDAPGTAWKSIGDDLPTQVVSGIGWSPAGGGTLFVLTGDNAYGGNTFAGIGGYRSTDGGATWEKASGLPEGVLGFKVAVDPVHPERIYAATGSGLFRSTDAGKTFTNLELPTGKSAPAGTPDCTGKPATAKDCFLANMVTDVVVQGADDAKRGGTPGAVMAAVGWRAGTKQNGDGAQQSPGNGMYTSATGDPGTFKNVDFANPANNVGANPADAITQPKIGRIALGVAAGADQDHRVVYAIVQDAAKFNGNPAGIDANEPRGVTSAAQSDFLNGIWVSTDFGQTWHQLEGATAIDTDTTSGSALAPPTCKTPAVIGYCPGVQAWYNLWIQPDPTRSTASGVPTRLAFGLEEVWNGERASGYDATAAGSKFNVIGRYFAGETCTLLTATNGLPFCPAASGGTVPKTTTHPDQHGGMFVPDGSGGVTLLAANDGGVYRQHVAQGQSFDNDHWGDGDNLGLHTLQPYDAAMAKDGTVYMGLQDNGEGKIEPSGKSYTVFGGDGFFSAVDPDNANVAYEEYVGGAMSVTTDGGRTWKSIQPSALTSAQFSTPFEMDTADANHLMIGGRDIEETTDGPGTSSSSWKKVFDLGTRRHPGDASASAATGDPDNQLSAVDVHSTPVPGNAPTGPHTPDFGYGGGSGTLPGGVDLAGDGSTFPPGTTDDHPFTIGPNDGDANVDVKITWGSANDDWDLFLYRNEGGKLVEVGSSAQGGTTSEEIVLPNPKAGDYVIRVANYAASGTYDAKVSFAQRTSSDATKSAAYVGFCGYCDTITQGTPFGNGIATNVGPSGAGTAGSPDGWHIAKAQGLPSRYITSVRTDPGDPKTVYVTLAGYGRRWAFPGAVGEDTSAVGTGHVYKSADAGETFTDISGNLPDIPANWTAIHDGQLVVGTDIGVFLSDNRDGGSYSVLGTGLPTAPVSTVRVKPGDPDTLFVATFGRGVYTYKFPPKAPAATASHAMAGNPSGSTGSAGSAGSTGSAGGTVGTSPSTATGAGGVKRTTVASSVPSTCASASGFRSVAVSARGGGLRFGAARLDEGAPYRVEVFQQATGRRVLPQRLVARFNGQRSSSFTWAGTTDRQGRALTDGLYFVSFTVAGKGTGADIRRIALERRSGTFTRRPDFYARTTCKVLRTAKLSGPSFGGVDARPLAIAFRLTRSGTAKVTVRQGSRTVMTKTVNNTGTVTRRVSLPASQATAGDYLVTIVATSGGRTETARLTSRRL